MRYAEIIEEFKSAPFVRIFIPFSIGIVIQMQFPHLLPSMVYPCLAIFVLMVISFVATHSYRYRWVFGLLTFIFLFCIGVFIAQQVKQESGLPFGVPLTLSVVIQDEPTEGARFTKYVAETKHVVDAFGDEERIKETILLYIPNKEAMLNIGDEMVVRAKLAPIPSPQNPYEFDYAKYLNRRQIFCSAFIRYADYDVVQTNQLGWLPTFYKSLRIDALNFFKKHGVSGEEFAVLQALTIGDKSLLDEDLKQSYSAVGATHILAVSGLHVGIIAMILGFFLKPLDRKRYGKYIRALALVSFLWLYALVAGLSPSVTRATIMFTVLIVGQVFTRTVSTYNSLAFAAFIICLVNPIALYDAGFQLSFLAVLSIVFFYPRIKKLFYFKNRIANGIWNLVAVSVAANIGTFPVVIYLFHQFPVFFILTNVLIMIPTSAIMFLFILALAFSWLNPVALGIVCLLNLSIKLLNVIIRFMDYISGGLFDTLWISSTQQWLLLLFIVSLTFFLWSKRKQVLILSVVVLTGFMFIHSYNGLQKNRQDILAVYNVKSKSLIAIVRGNMASLISDVSEVNNNFDYNLKNHAVSMGFTGMGDVRRVCLQEIHEYEDSISGIFKSYIRKGNTTIKILTNEVMPIPISVDYLILTADYNGGVSTMLDVYKPSMVVLDASIPSYRRSRVKSELTSRNIDFYDVKEKGAFIRTF